MTAAAPCTVLAAYDIGRGRQRSVVVLDETRKLTVTDTPLGSTEPGEAMFTPCTLADLYGFAVRCLAGDAAALTHPKAILALATALVASVALDPTVNKGGSDDPEV